MRGYTRGMLQKLSQQAVAQHENKRERKGGEGEKIRKEQMRRSSRKTLKQKQEVGDCTGKMVVTGCTCGTFQGTALSSRQQNGAL